MSKKVLEFDLTGRKCAVFPTDTLYLPYHGDVVAGMRFTQVFDYNALPGDVLSLRLELPKHSNVIVFVAEYPDVFLERDDRFLDDPSASAVGTSGNEQGEDFVPITRDRSRDEMLDK